MDYTNKQETLKDMKIDYLLTVISKMENIAGEWNGDERGAGEEKASIALEIKETCLNLLKLMYELENY